jgi:hypothetical protein
MLTTDLTLGTFNNPYLAGKFGDYDFTGTSPYVDFSELKTDRKKGRRIKCHGSLFT